MKKILILRGLPASGKSTFARQLLQDNIGSWKRLNKDELRAMLDNSVHSGSNEKFVERVRDMMLVEALKEGKNVIIDDTNLSEKPIERIREVVKQYSKQTGQSVTIEFKLLDTPLEECIRRDENREKKVGREVIMQFYNQHFLRKTDNYFPDFQIKKSLLENRVPHYRVQDDTLPPAIICDLDGTLAIIHNRSPYDAKSCETDLLNEPIAEILKTYHQKGTKIILMSGREDNAKQQTINWLHYNRIQYDALYMRKAGDSRKDAVVKKELFEQHINDPFFVAFVLDDRNQVVDLWRNELGLACLQVNYGDF
jgi:predicted kinase